MISNPDHNHIVIKHDVNMHPDKTIVLYAALVTVSIILMLQGSYGLTQNSSGKGTVGVFPLESKPYGLTLIPRLDG